MMLRSSEKTSRPYCDNCQKKIDIGKVISCGDCRRNFHDTCTKLPEGASGPWKCSLCSPKQKGETSTQQDEVQPSAAKPATEEASGDLKQVITQLVNLQTNAQANLELIRENIRAEKESRDLEMIEIRAALNKITAAPPKTLWTPLRQIDELNSSTVSVENTIRAPLPLRSNEPEHRNIQAPQLNELTTFMKRQALTALPKFNGSPKAWPKFIRVFRESTRECAFSNSENLSRLEAALEGRAARSVQQLMIDSANVPIILQRLEENFGKPKFIYDELLGELQRLKRENRSLIIDMSDTLENMTTNMTVINQEGYLRDSRLLDELVSKLPRSLQIDWTRQRQAANDVPSLLDLCDWLKPHAAIERNMTHLTTSQFIPRGRLNVHDGERAREKCPVCSNEHRIFECRRFKDMSISERCQQTIQKKLCFCCLGKGHLINDCRKSRRCGLNGCNRHHNRMLHSNSNPSREENTSSRNSPRSTPEIADTHYHEEQTNKKYYQIIPVTLQNGRHSIDTYAFLDTGSSLTLLDEDMASALDLHGREEPLRLKWTQDMSREETNSKIVQVRIQGSSRKSFRLDGVRTVKNLQLPTQSLDYKKLADKHPYLKDLPIKNYELAKPTILIGLNQSHLLIAMDTRKGGINDPIAVRSKLGWFIFGNITSNIEYGHLMIHHVDEDLRDMTKTYFSTEDFGVKISEKLPEAKELSRSKAIIEETLKRKDGRYEVGLLWKDEDFSFPENYTNAFKRLCSIERSLAKDQMMKEWAINTFREYLKKGYIRKLTKEELSVPTSRVCYLPHFIVTSKNKLTPKPRLVFDAAAKTNGVSLNSALLSGPDATTSLYGILLRFRENKIAICGDIKEMFHQVMIRTEDQHAQRFLWRECDISRDPDVYIMQVMTFGSTCSPSCAQAAKNANAEEFKDLYPDAAEVIIKQHYVDDCVESFNKITSAIKTMNEVIRIHEKGGFHIRNFVSNSKTLLQALPSDRVQTNQLKIFNQNDSQVEKVLGVYWNTSSDTFSYMVKMDKLGSEIIQGQRRPTWREVMAFVLSIYDPLGLIANITIQGKLILQQVHKTTTNWDEEIPASLNFTWNTWLETLAQTENVHIPRLIQIERPTYNELHVFVDASEMAYAACIYIKSVNENRSTVNLLTAKARVAPLKALSIPRLELQAAVLGARLLATVKEEMRISIKRSFLWSDSQTVLAWIQSSHRDFKQFVAHRVGEILDTTTIDQWKYVSTKLNPADAATRSASKHSMWLTGPSFLKESEENWPQTKKQQTTEEKRNFVLLHTDSKLHWFIMEYRYSSWQKMLSHLCILNRVAERYWFKKLGLDIPSPWITVEDRRMVENALFRKAQWDSFSEEMTSLVSNRPIPSTSRLATLTPMLDHYGVMRSRSRLEFGTKLPDTMKLPIILPPGHKITRLIVRDAHERYHHTAFNVVIGVLQEKYHIPRLRSILDTEVKHCKFCSIQRAQPQAPFMAALPDSRITPHLPVFSHCGVDYFGPYEVVEKRSTVVKRWGVIFTCLASRAVHIELAERLDTSCFIRCFQDFMCRRGQVTHLYSDNGTNFVGAEREMREQLEKLNTTMGRARAAELEIKWTFNPPHAPHFGGAWERLIGLIKNALKHMLTFWKHGRPSAEVLRSALIRAEFIVNSRPLTDIPIKANEETAITPFHFILGRPGTSAPPYDVDPSPYTNKDYLRIQQAAKYFWDRWKNEYLPTLIKRKKWINDIPPVKLDDIVVIADDSIVPGRWLKGRVIKLISGQDNIVRSVKVLTKTGPCSRPVTKIAILDLEPSEEPTVKEQGDKATPTPKADPVIVQPTKIPSKHVSTKKEILDKALSCYGKRKVTDIDYVKGLANKFKNNQPKRRRVGNIRPISTNAVKLIQKK